jgi:collagen type I/II/III/V/XI/XXIV/XXVII alpha
MLTSALLGEIKKMSGSAFTWGAASGGSWAAAGNWLQGTTQAIQAPGSLDLTQFVAFSGTVTGSVGAQALDIGPGSALTLGGSGFFSSIVIGQDLAFNSGAATLSIESGVVVAATLLNIGSVAGGGGTLVADGTFSTTGGITLGSPGFGATIQVDAGGEVDDSASNLTMGNGGLISVAPSGEMVLGSGGGVGGAFSINSGHVFSGIGTIAANVVDNGSLATANFGNPGTVLAITGAVTGTGSLSAVQELDVGGAIGSGIAISLFGNGGTNAGLLRLAQPMQDAGTLVTMSTNSTIALTGLTFDSAVWSLGSLTMTGASGTLTLATSGDHSHQAFVTQPDPVSGTDVIVMACFAAGTRISTARGEVAVEAIRIGDLAHVVGQSAAALPVIWLGHRTVDCTRHPNPANVWPVRIAADAFGPGRPCRDLWLSPDHALYLGEVLIPVKYLINDTTIAQIPRDQVTYYHVELPRHSVLLAEAQPSESYLDIGDHSSFTNGDGPISLYPDFASRRWEAEACAPLIVSGPIVEAARQCIGMLASVGPVSDARQVNVRAGVTR